MQQKNPVALIILDGWGYREATADNAIANAHTPHLDKLWSEYPHTLISGSGEDVGLPAGQMGNSEVGHMNLGAGRVVYQDFTKVTKAITDGDFFTNTALIEAIDTAVNAGKAVHLMGLLSPGGVHSHQNHIIAACRLAQQRGAKRIYVHGFLDGRDTPPTSAAGYIEQVEVELASMVEPGVTMKIATLCGRYFAMDRDQRWDRIDLAYQLLVDATAEMQAESASAGIQMAYQQQQTDEFVRPITCNDYPGMADGDALLFMNFRADRARQLASAFLDEEFAGFKRTRHCDLCFVMLTQYADSLHAPVAFPPERLTNGLGEWLASQGKTQLRISETEKYAHVTFFFSGGVEQEYPNESRELIPSPQVATYDLQPEMNSELLTDKLCAAIRSGQFDTIVCNYPNGDMVGHTGNYDAAVKACEAVDRSIGRVIEALAQVGGECLITADHGNAEQMQDPDTEQRHTAHTSQPVPMMYFGRPATFRNGGVLSDVAPTILQLLGLPQPPEMTGRSLFVELID